MLTFNQQYDLANGIFITYDSQLDYRLMHSKHKTGTRENSKTYFPYQKWESRTKETFVLACIYIIFNNSPSSFRSFLGELRELDLKEIEKFKHQIINYQDYIGKDVGILKEKYGLGVEPQNVLKEYLSGNIQFYTAWWYIKFYKQDWVPGRTFTHIIRKLKFIMLFLTFKEESILRIEDLFKQIEL